VICNRAVRTPIPVSTTFLTIQQQHQSSSQRSETMKSHGSRKFYQLPDPPSSSECAEDPLNGGTKQKKYRSKSAFFRGSTRDLIEMVDQNIIGKETVFQGPFGPRRSKLASFFVYISDHLMTYDYEYDYDLLQNTCIFFLLSFP
jgi:hypothetical protein